MMKKSIFFIGLLALVTISVNGNTFREVIVPHLKKCVRDTNPAREIMRSAARLNNLDNKNVTCLLHCSIKSAGLIKDGKFDLNFVEDDMIQRHQFDEKTKQAFKQRMNECKRKAEQEADECQRSGTLFACINPIIKWNA